MNECRLNAVVGGALQVVWEERITGFDYLGIRMREEDHYWLRCFGGSVFSISWISVLKRLDNRNTAGVVNEAFRNVFIILVMH